jgi:S1-C subfamily serine protease
MPIRVVCPECQAAYQLPDTARGQPFRCKRCGETLTVGGEAPKDDLHDTKIRSANRKGPTGPRKETADAKPTAAGIGRKARVLASRRRDQDEEPEQGWSEAAAKKKAKGSAAAMWVLIGGVLAAAVLLVVVIILFPPGSHDGNSEQAAAPPDTSASITRPPVPPDTGNEPPPAPPPPKDPGVKDPVKEVPVLGPDGRLLPAVVDKIKRATVALRVTLPDGRLTQGTGFLGVEPRLVLTHMRALGLLGADGRRPQKVEVLLGEGADARTIAAEVLGVDRASELAVLRLPDTAEGLPKSLDVQSARDLAEKQRLFVFGLARDTQPGKEIAVVPASVGELRKDDANLLTQVQVAGEVNPGQSGGPVVDTRGQVVGVVVVGGDPAGSWAVPGDTVLAALNGRPAAVTLQLPYWQQGQGTFLPVQVELFDPLGRVRWVGIDCWAGAPGDPRPPSSTKPMALAGDGPRKTAILNDRDGPLAGAVPLPPLGEGQVYWVQPTYASGSSPPVWDPATVYELKAPLLIREPAPLVQTHGLGRRALVLKAQATYKVRDSADAEHTVLIHLDARLQEETKAIDQQKGEAKVHLQYKSVAPRLLLDGKERPRSARLQLAMQRVELLAQDLTVDRQGEIVESVEHKAALRKLPLELRQEVADLGGPVQKALEAVAVPLPGAGTNPGQKWRTKRTLPVATPGKPEPAVLDLTCTYLGTRTTAGRKEAVIGLEGKARGQRNDGANLAGRVGGTAVLDLASGTLTLVRLTLNVDLDMPLPDRPALANGTLEVQLERGLPSRP